MKPSPCRPLEALSSEQSGALSCTSSATISECGDFRYDLRRIENAALPLVGWIMCNPSTADDTEDGGVLPCLM